MRDLVHVPYDTDFGRERYGMHADDLAPMALVLPAAGLWLAIMLSGLGRLRLTWDGTDDVVTRRRERWRWVGVNARRPVAPASLPAPTVLYSKAARPPHRSGVVIRTGNDATPTPTRRTH